MDLVEWSMIRDEADGAYYVQECHALGYDAKTRTVRHRLLVALYGPYDAEQAEQIKQAAADFRLYGVSRWLELDAAERMPEHYTVVAHLGEDILDPDRGGYEEEEEEQL